MGIQENCGLFGLFSKSDCAQDIYQGIDFLQHRGQEYCGISTWLEGIRLITHHGKVLNTFTDPELSYLGGHFGIGHVSLKERQPVRWHSNLGEIAVAFSGNVINADELIQEMLSRGKAFTGRFDIEVIAKVIMEERDPVAGIAALAGAIKGAYSLLVLTGQGIFAARDVWGFRPLVLGVGELGYAVSSESRALHNLDMEVIRDVQPGEIVLLNKEGFTTVRQLDSPGRAHCAFEWAYTSSIDSFAEGVSVQKARNDIGAKLAERDLEEGDVQADLVAPVPMSGVGHAIGYHMRSKINYQEVFLYNRYADRSYTQSTQVAREKMAKRKLSVLRHAVKGQRIILCDDSIVRGTQILNKVRELKEAGAREVHVRIACPPLMYPCDFGISTRTYDELIARAYMYRGDINNREQLQALESWVADRIHADSVRYNDLEAFVQAMGLPQKHLCLRCFNGCNPLNESGTA